MDLQCSLERVPSVVPSKLSRLPRSHQKTGQSEDHQTGGDMAAIHIGISGWRYTPWRGDFYPKGLAQKRELQFASRAVNSIDSIRQHAAARGRQVARMQHRRHRVSLAARIGDAPAGHARHDSRRRRRRAIGLGGAGLGRRQGDDRRAAHRTGAGGRRADRRGDRAVAARSGLVGPARQCHAGRHRAASTRRRSRTTTPFMAAASSTTSSTTRRPRGCCARPRAPAARRSAGSTCWWPRRRSSFEWWTGVRPPAGVMREAAHRSGLRSFNAR